MTISSPNPDVIPLSVTLALQSAKLGQWQYEKIALISLARSTSSTPSQTLLHEDDNGRFIIWRGLPLALQKEAVASYWANLSSQQPQLFIICRHEEEGTRPIQVTVSGEEAAGHGEVDDNIVDTPLPHWLNLILKDFVSTHYHPQPKKVRRRQ